MALFGSPHHISGRDAQTDLLEAIWPGLGSDPNPNLHAHRNRCCGKVNDALIVALAADEICAWTDNGGDAIRVPRAYWDSERGRFYFYKGDIQTGGETKNPDLERYYGRPWYLLQSDFEQFKRRLQDGGPSQYVWLFDALRYVAAGGANEAAVMRWDCEIYRSSGHEISQETYNQKHSDLLEAALAKLQDAWARGLIRPFGRLAGKRESAEEPVKPPLAERCEFLPLGPGRLSRIEAKEPFKSRNGDRWDHVRFLRHDLNILLPAAHVHDPLTATHWTIPQCIAWIASRTPEDVSMATHREGLRALAGAMVAGPGNFSSSYHRLLNAFRTGLTCLGIDRSNGVPGNIPIEQRAHVEFDLEHNAALINVEVRWHDLRFPVSEVLKTWPAVTAIAEVDEDGDHANGRQRFSEGKVKRWLEKYRASLNGGDPDPQNIVREQVEAALECQIGEKIFRKILRDMDENRDPGQPALLLPRGKKAQNKSAG